MQSIGRLKFNNSTPRAKIRRPTDVNGRGKKNIKIKKSMQKKIPHLYSRSSRMTESKSWRWGGGGHWEGIDATLPVQVTKS